jgi:hypothetical protein
VNLDLFARIGVYAMEYAVLINVCGKRCRQSALLRHLRD